MKIVLLIGSFVPHQMTLIYTLIEKYNAEIHAVSVSKNYTYCPEGIANLKTYKLHDFTTQDLLQKILAIDPDIIVSAGWMIPEYNRICKKLKIATNIPIVAMSDTPWYNSFKQKINALIARFHVKTKFTHIWVAGFYQYDYARKLGFSNDQIIYNCLSADTTLFRKISIAKKAENYPKNFLYIGRYTEIKGLRNLADAWSAVIDKKDWTFTLVGAGKMGDELRANDGFIVKDYMTQDFLLNEMQNAGCFVLPSLHEPWALVIHEAAAAGLPIICTKTCGAAPHFVIDNFNGLKIENDSVYELTKSIEAIIQKTTAELTEYSYNSRNLSDAISPEKGAANLMQLLKKQ